MKICVIGSMNIDHNMTLDHFPKEGETIRAKSYQQYYGGKGGNQATACRRLGLEVGIVACIGKDPLGLTYKEYLEKDGIHTALIKHSKLPTGTAFIEIDGSGENKIITVGGANYDLDESWLQEHLKEILTYDIFMFSLEIPPKFALKFMKILNEHNKIIILDPAPSRNFDPIMLEYITYVTPNETELNEIPLSAKVILKEGANGSKHQGIHVDGYKVNTVDTVGAGDTFNSAIAYGITQGFDTVDLLQFANATAAISTESYGAQTGMPTATRVIKFLEHKKEV